MNEIKTKYEDNKKSGIFFRGVRINGKSLSRERALGDTGTQRSDVPLGEDEDAADVPGHQRHAVCAGGTWQTPRDMISKCSAAPPPLEVVT